ncbi:MAG: hypothetical protein JWQ38_2395, partial [Flavipsychrobacter sp.]|nr:hypothetical protein [Flavipsychrobacter sp.]
DYELTNRYDTDNIMLIEKFNPEKVVSAIYYEAKSKQFNVKRFVIESQTLKTRYNIVKDGDGNFLKLVTTQQEPIVIVRTGKKKSDLTEETFHLHESVDITGWRTIGIYLASEDAKEIVLVPEISDETGEPEAPTLF